jgi:hypothetical protein
VVLADSAETLNEFTARRSKSIGYFTALMRISTLAPSIVEDILNGRQRPALGAKRLLRTSSTLPLDWAPRRARLGFRSPARSGSRNGDNCPALKCTNRDAAALPTART